MATSQAALVVSLLRPCYRAVRGGSPGQQCTIHDLSDDMIKHISRSYDVNYLLDAFGSMKQLISAGEGGSSVQDWISHIRGQHGVSEFDVSLFDNNKDLLAIFGEELIGFKKRLRSVWPIAHLNHILSNDEIKVIPETFEKLVRDPNQGVHSEWSELVKTILWCILDIFVVLEVIPRMPPSVDAASGEIITMTQEDKYKQQREKVENIDNEINDIVGRGQGREVPWAKSIVQQFVKETVHGSSRTARLLAASSNLQPRIQRQHAFNQ